MTITIDIKTRFLPDTQRAFIVFPGEGYRFHHEMRDQSFVFLDLPGFPVPSLGKDGRVDDSDFIKRIAMSERIKKWYAQRQPEDEIPVRQLEKIKNCQTTKRRLQLAGIIRNFYFNVKKGDIVIVPGRNVEDEVLFGEIIDDHLTETISVSRYNDDQIPARKVRWIKRIPRGKISPWLERKIPHPTAVQQIEGSRLFEIFDLMYQRYFYKDQFVCKFSVTSNDFSAYDNFLFQQMLLYVAALHEENAVTSDLDIKTESIASIVAHMDFFEDIPDQRINIQSPGDIVVYAKNIIPLVFAVFLSMSADQAHAYMEESKKAAQIHIINTADVSSSSDKCTAEIKAEVIQDLEAMGYEKWKELCKLENKTRSRTGLASGVKTKQDASH